jgi:signal transduction protein with GAF and PtsI domain
MTALARARLPGQRRMSESAALVELLQSIAAATRERLDAAACSVALLDGDDLVFQAADGVGADQVVGLRLPIGRGLAGWVVASGQGIAVADVRRDQRFDAETAQRTGYVPTTMLVVPVDDDEGPIGVLEVLDREPGAHDMEIAARAARQVCIAQRIGERLADAAKLVADPQMAEMVTLLRQFDQAAPRERSLAVALLTSVLNHRD